ncbi:MAG: endonuclease [Bacteroidia bacterium]|nr:endonuclease [Bacteroidia bacterium]
MRIKIKNVAVSVVLSVLIKITYAQSSLPISWNCGGNLPTGFSQSGVAYYSPSSFTCTTAPSLKFIKSGDYLMMQFAQQPGTLVYYIKSQSAYNGVFRIQESADGSLWTNLREYKNNSTPTVTTTCTKDSVTTTNTSTRYLRFYNAANVNVEIDEITVKAPTPSLPELYASIQNNNIINNGNAPALSANIGGSSLYSINLKNTGIATALTIDSIKITGVAKNDYTVTNTLPLNINSGNNTNITVNFTPSASGSRQAKLIVISNSSSNQQYTINLNGVGGTLATIPDASNNATSIKFYNIKTYRYTVSVRVPLSKTLDANGGYIIVRTTDSLLNSNPVNGTTYKRGSGFGNGKVVYNGAIKDSIYFNPTWIHAGKTYRFYVFPYNGSSNTINYRIADALKGSVTTPSTMLPSNKYTSINPTAATFVSDLTALTRPHTSTAYADYARTMVDLFETRDTDAVYNNIPCEKAITCQYSGLNRPYSYPFVWTTYDFSREHTYCHSWMPSYPADNPEKQEYNDQHYLFATCQTKANAPRCNYPMGEVITPTYSYLECKLGLNAAGQKVFEPRDTHKGRVARAMMYVSVAYNTPSVNWGYPNRPVNTTCSGTPIPYLQDEYIIKKWNYLYPPTGYEIARNDFLDSLQGNRNPFIDHPEWACYIDFKNMVQTSTMDSLCQRLIGFDDNKLDRKIYLFPNPARTQFTIGILEPFEKAKIEVYNVEGKKVYSKKCPKEPLIEENIATENWTKGLYLLKFESEKGNFERKIVIE